MAFDTYMMIDGGAKVKGESQATGMTNAFEVYSFSFGASNPTTIGSGSAGFAGGKVSLSSFNVMKKSEAASALLFSACCTGDHYDTIVITMRKAAGSDTGQKPFLVYTFKDCMIESIQWSGSTGGDDSPTESLSIAYGAVKIEYSKQDAKGAMTPAGTATWSQITNTKTFPA